MTTFIIVNTLYVKLQKLLDRKSVTIANSRNVDKFWVQLTTLFKINVTNKKKTVYKSAYMSAVI